MGLEEKIVPAVGEEAQADTTEQAAHTEHSGHHKHHRHHRRSMRRRLNSFFRKHKWTVINSLILVALVSIIVILYSDLQKTKKNLAELQQLYLKQNEKEESVLESELSPEGLTAKMEEERPLLIESVVDRYLKTTEYSSLYSFLEDNSLQGQRHDNGVPAVLTYSAGTLMDGILLQSVRGEVSEHEDYSDALVVELTGTDAVENGAMIFRFLKTGTEYHYRVQAILSDKSMLSTEGSFTTAESPRLLSIDGIMNVRDIGGWKTEDGKVVRQGMIIRGCSLDGSENKEAKITDQGISDMVTRLGIVYDMDLRESKSASNEIYPLGGAIHHEYIDSIPYVSALQESGKAVTGKIFKQFANKDNYPVYLHCAYGIDRTGTICYILEALLGMSYEDMTREYELSNLYYTKRDLRAAGSEFELFQKAFEELTGESPREKAENYLLSCGLNEEEIDSIRTILLVDQ